MIVFSIISIVLLILSLFSINYVLSTIKLPLAVIGGIMVFIYSTSLIIVKLRVGRNYGAICGALLGFLTSYYIYQLDLFTLFVSLVIIYITGYVIAIFTKMKKITDMIKVIKEG